MEQTFQISVYGKVQGVYYRAWTSEKAQEMRLKGNVRNQPDGSVLIHVTGPEAKIRELAKMCENGPERALVTKVFIQSIPFVKFEKFEILR